MARRDIINTSIWAVKSVAVVIAELIFAISISFFLIHAMPGNPYQIILVGLLQRGIPYEQAKIMAAALAGYNPNVNPIVSWAGYMWSVFHGNLGYSLIYRAPVIKIIATAAPWTILLVAVSLTLAFATGYILGLYAASKTGIVDALINGSLSFFQSIPSYVLALILIIIFGVLLKIAPIAGAYSSNVTPGFTAKFILDVMRHLALPLLTYYLVIFPGWVFGTRSLAISITHEDFVLVAKARSLPEKRITFTYIGKNALLPQLTALLYSYGLMFGSSIFIESTFAIPGLGYVLAIGSGSRDYLLTIGSFLIIIIAVILGNFIADVTYGLIDPRVRGV